MNMIEMKGALSLTRQGRLKEAVALLRGKPAMAPKPVPAGFVPGVLQDVLDRMGQAPARAKAPEAPAGGSRFEQRSYNSAAGSLKYKLFIPSGYTGAPVPLVVMLHGCTQSPDDFAAGTGMNGVAEARNFLVAYPAQARGANISKCWNWFNLANQRRGEGEAALIAGITGEVMRDFAVAPGRVFVAGMSAGGAAAAIMGAAYPELFAAIGVHSGLACGAASDMGSAMTAMRQGGVAPPGSRLVPTIVFHGDRDTTVNVVNADQVIAQAKAGAPLRTQLIEGVAGEIGYTRTVQTDERGRAVLEEWVLHGAGHAWSGGSKAGSFADPRGPDASAEMVRFFLQQK
jgi:poly(hydroxyalkanoate) depolymerase family esterase